MIPASRLEGECRKRSVACDIRPSRTRRDNRARRIQSGARSEEHTSELQSRLHLVCRLLLEKKKKHLTVYDFEAYNCSNSSSTFVTAGLVSTARLSGFASMFSYVICYGLYTHCHIVYRGICY